MTEMDGALALQTLAALQGLLDDAGHDIDLRSTSKESSWDAQCGQCGDWVHLARLDACRLATRVPAQMLVGCQPGAVLTILVGNGVLEAARRHQ